MMKYKLIIFDLDGTILDTIEDLKNSVNFALGELNLPKHTYDEIKAIVGHGIRNLVERSVPTGTDIETVDRAFSLFKEHYAVHQTDNTCPYDGVLEMAGALKARGYHIAVLSNKADGAVKNLADHFFPGLFELNQGELPGIPKKPDPGAVQSVMDAFGVTKDETVYIGDSEVDVETARRAGLFGIAVDWGFRSRETLVEAGATHIAHTPDEVLAFL